MATLSLRGKGSVDEIAALLSAQIPQSGISCEQIASLRKTVGKAVIHLLVFEKYYMRSSNRASLTVLITGADGHVAVDAVGAGGGQGALFRFSWGVEEDFVREVASILRRHGFSQ